jgi:hypothetical protein
MKAISLKAIRDNWAWLCATNSSRLCDRRWLWRDARDKMLALDASFGRWAEIALFFIEQYPYRAVK